MKAVGLGLLVSLLSASAQRDQPSLLEALQNGYTLPVSYVQQPKDSNWCWAAVGETIMAYHGHDVSKERQVEDYSAKSDGLKVGGKSDDASISDIGGWPQFETYGFHATQTEKALSYGAIVQELLIHRRPIAYAYSPKGRMGHIVSIIGFSKTEDGSPCLIAYDSDIPSGTIRIPYLDYAKTYGYNRHLRTYHQVYPKK